MPSATYTLFRKAILAEQQVTCIYGDRRRELCPHIIGTNKDGDEVVLAWQFAGDSSGKLPQWRCLRLKNVRDAKAHDGEWFAGGSHRTTQRCVEWFAGGSHRTTQRCVTDIDLDINVHVRKLR